ncbi:MAG TPA: TetR family transcriptional regulator [Flavobacterium sp.]|nr:TetR family transcriptional regulator [Flavobacterium sp.]
MKEHILNKAIEMFLSLGFKSVTMDDIAAEMGISKKTIYLHYSNKDTLVKAVTSNLFETISSGIDAIITANTNPIEEWFKIKDFVMLNLKNENTSPLYQLQKYYPKIHQSLSVKQFNKMGCCVIENLNKGICQGLYRENLNKELISRFYFASMTSIKNVELFDPLLYSSNAVQTCYLEYHLRGICTLKGIEILDQILTQNHQKQI